MVFKQLAPIGVNHNIQTRAENASAVASAATDQIDWRGGIKPSAAMDPHTKICISSIQPRRRPRAFFSGLHCVASRSPYELAAGSPPSLRDGDLLRPHRSPYCLRACSLCNLTEKRSNVKLGSFGVKRSISGAQTNFQI